MLVTWRGNGLFVRVVFAGVMKPSNRLNPM